MPIQIPTSCLLFLVGGAYLEAKTGVVKTIAAKASLNGVQKNKRKAPKKTKSTTRKGTAKKSLKKSPAALKGTKPRSTKPKSTRKPSKNSRK